MALQIWCPFTDGTLKQQGLLNISPVVNGTTTFVAGKLGQALSCNGSSYWSISGLTVGNTASIACWSKTSTNGKMQWVLESNVSNRLNLYESDIYTLNTGDSNNNPFQADSGENISCLHDGAWHHFVVTWDGSVSKLYIDGEYRGKAKTYRSPASGSTTRALKIAGGYNDGHTYDWNGAINDFRYYDHCLSPMEVKELAKGLVLHYPLNRGGWGQENLLSRYVVPGQAAPTSTAAGGRTTWLGDYKITIPATENADTYFRLFTTKQLTTNATYTISCNVDGLLSGSYYRFPLYAQGNTAMGVLNLDHNGLCSLTFTMTYGTQTAATGANGETVYICFMDDISRAIASGQGAITISNFKLEEGSIATPWCPNSSDALATTMGLNGTTEYDCSGFCNNGTRTGTFSWISDTPKYSVSQYFNGSSYSKTDSGTFSWFAFDKCTVAIWMKPATLPSSWAGTFGIAHDNSSTNKSFAIGNYGGKFTVQSANGSWVNIQASDLPINEWHHCVATLDGTTIKMYMDGELVKTDTINWGTTTVASDTRIQVGIDLPGSDEVYQGYYSDARIYATALSADDVKSLYQNCATIDPDGTIRGQIRS